MTDLTEELRIIAQDGGKLSKADCGLIVRAADEIESGWATIRRIEARIGDLEAQLQQLRQHHATPTRETWLVSSGWMPCGHNPQAGDK